MVCRVFYEENTDQICIISGIGYVVEMIRMVVRNFSARMIKLSFLAESHLKRDKPMLSINSHQWAPTYAPPPSSPPKLYKLVRNIQSISIDHDFHGEHPENHNEPFHNSNPEVARKLFASLRHTSQGPQSSSIESSDIGLGDQLRKSTRRNQLQFIRTSPFLQSITYSYE